MLRVIIADDEERICRLIKALAQWDELGMSVVGIAGNGLEALEMVGSLSPDILITDIRMPGLGGLELISRTKTLSPQLEVIIISGYAQFDYAQIAIQHGVGEYLLKPINKEALNSTLAKMGERCRQRKKMATTIETLQEGAKDERERLRAGLIPDLLEGRFLAADADALHTAYAFGEGGDTWQVFLLKMDYPADPFPEPSLQIIRSRAAGILGPLLEDVCLDAAFGHRGAYCYGVMNYPDGQREALRAHLRDGLNQLVGLTDLFGPVVFSMALGQAVKEPASIAASFESARDIITERLMEGTSRLLEGMHSPSPFLAAGPLDAYVRDIAQAVELLSLPRAEAAALSLAEAAMGTPNIRGKELLSLVKSAGAIFAARLGMEGRAKALSDFVWIMDQCPTANALFSALQSWQRDLLTEAIHRRQNQDGQPIRLAKQYIQKHFHSPLSLEEVSDAVGFSVTYFSMLFKKEVGEGFARYVTRVRMEEARSLLRETRLPVAEICNRVGYGDIKHFTRTFKGACGVTPSEFRKLYG